MALPRSLPNQITIARLVLALALFVLLHLVGWAESQPVVRRAIGADALATFTPSQGAVPNPIELRQRGLEHLAALAGQPSPVSRDEASRVLLAHGDSTETWAVAIGLRERLLLNLAAVIFILAAISDILDGQIARRWNLTTDFGRIADPFADKVVVTGSFLFLIPIAGSGVAAWMVVLIVARESLVDGIRGFAESRGLAFPASFWGKAKMVLLSAAIIWILEVKANLRDESPWEEIARGVLYSSLVAVVISGAVYLFRARKILGQGAGGAKLDAKPAAVPAPAEASR